MTYLPHIGDEFEGRENQRRQRVLQPLMAALCPDSKANSKVGTARQYNSEDSIVILPTAHGRACRMAGLRETQGNSAPMYNHIGWRGTCLSEVFASQHKEAVLGVRVRGHHDVHQTSHQDLHTRGRQKGQSMVTRGEEGRGG